MLYCITQHHHLLHCVLREGEAELVIYHDYISWIDVPLKNRRQGVGGRLLQRACDWADRHHRMLKLLVHGYDDGPNNDELWQWYMRHGFIGRRPHMFRLPQWRMK